MNSFLCIRPISGKEPFMNSNRGQYNSSPLYNLKNTRRAEEKKRAAQQETAPGGNKRYGLLSIMLSLVLPVLFLVSLLVPNNTLRWVFLAAAGLSVLAMWVLRAFVNSARATLTVIYLALAAVIGLALIINQQIPPRSAAVSKADQAAAMFSQSDASSINAMINELSTATPNPQEAEEQKASSEAQSRMEGFFQAWGQNSVSEMLPFCLPSWVSQQSSPNQTLFQLLSRSRPTNLLVEGVSGSDGNATRIVTAKVYFDENGVTEVKRMHVMMHKINDVWYVNPDSLDGVTVDEAAEAAQNQSAMVASTIAPTAVPSENEEEEVIVYYNTKGGKYYHLDDRCSRVATEYWPLTGKIPLSMLNVKPYDQLIPCDWCGAPARPSN